VRYTPADSTVEILTKVTVHLFTGPAEYERISPNRETEFSAAMRQKGILSLVANPEDIVFYQSPTTIEDIATIQAEPEPISIVQTEDSRAASHDVAEGACEQIVSSSISAISSSSQRQPVDVAAIPAGVVDLAVFDGDHRIETAEIPLISGSHTVEIPLASRINSVGDLRIVADPFNEIDEMDETNNISVVEKASFSNGAVQEMFIPSPARSIQLNLSLITPITGRVSVKVYSVQSGTSNLSIGTEDELPTGIYTVCIEGFGPETITRRVVLLDE